MNRRTARLAAVVVFVFLLPVSALAQVPFVDAEKDHWAFEAMDNLQKKGILTGYPDGHFRGKRTMSRNEFAVALDRALKNLPGNAPHSPPGEMGAPGAPGPAGERGPAGEMGPAGIRPKELDDIRRLATEFRGELTGLGNNLQAINRRLDFLAKDVADIKAELSKGPRISGRLWMGLRSANVNGAYVDYDGRPTPQLGQQFPRYTLQLGIDTPLSAGAPPGRGGGGGRGGRRGARRADAANQSEGGGDDEQFRQGALLDPQEAESPVMAGRARRDWDLRDAIARANGFDPFYHSSSCCCDYCRPPLIRISDRLRDVPRAAWLSSVIEVDNLREYYSGSYAIVLPFQPNPSGDVTIHKLDMSFPISPIGKRGVLDIGRIPVRQTPFTLWKPDVDTYFNVPMVDDSHYYIDGVKYRTHICHLVLEAFAGKMDSVRGSSGPAWNSPLAGVSLFGGSTGQPIFFGGDKTAGQLAGITGGAIVANQIAGASIGFPIPIGDGRGKLMVNEASGDPSSGFGGIGYNAVKTIGSEFTFRPCSHSKLRLDWAKTMTLEGRQTFVGLHENNAFNAEMSYRSAGLNLSAGYRYIDPRFYAPGYWGRIGNWINPTNIQGPGFRAGYDLSKSFGLTAGGDFYSAARDRALSSGALDSGLGRDDDITRVLVGFRWDIAKRFRTTIDWEGVYWSLSGDHSGIPAMGAGSIHPTEHYITFGTGYDLTSNTRLRMSYQIGSFDGHGALGVGPAFGGVSGTSYNFNTFTTQLAVRF